MHVEYIVTYVFDHTRTGINETTIPLFKMNVVANCFVTEAV